MFAKKFRLSSKERISASGIITTPLFTMRIAKNNLSHNRYGFVISKKAEKKAVARNRLKRQFRSLLEEKNLNLSQGFDLLFSLRKQIAREKRRRMEDELCRALQKLKLI